MFSLRSARIAFEDPQVRKVLLEFANKTRGKLTDEERSQLLSIGILEARTLMTWVVDTFGLHYTDVSVVPFGVRQFIRCIATTSPVCSYLHPSDENIQMVKSLTEENIRAKPFEWHQLQMELPMFYELLKDLASAEVLPSDVFTRLFTYLIHRAEDPFNPDNRLPDLPLSTDTPLAWYVTLNNHNHKFKSNTFPIYEVRNRCKFICVLRSATTFLIFYPPHLVIC